MMNFKSIDGGPGLLVSVRSAGEALEALAGGADVIDVKEPKLGSLGPADPSTIGEVVRAVNGRSAVTAALGELTEFGTGASQLHLATLPGGISLFKIGLAGCRGNANWSSTWHETIGRVTDNCRASSCQPVAVAYADWHAANGPPPMEVMLAAEKAGCPALLVDTWDKSSGTLFDHWPVMELRSFINDVRSRGISIVLAGSLVGAAVKESARLGPDLIAVRTAACVGGRVGMISRERVRAIKQAIAATRAA
jgi:uncharacterized protein (UPF0264 family)